MGRVIEFLPKNNDEFDIEHKPGTNIFTLRKEN